MTKSTRPPATKAVAALIVISAAASGFILLLLLALIIGLGATGLGGWPVLVLIGIFALFGSAFTGIAVLAKK